MSNSGDSELALVINPLGNLTGPPANRLMTAGAKADAPRDGWGGTVEASQTGKPTFKPGLETSALAATGAETAACVARSLTLSDWKSGTNVSFDLDDYPLVAAHCNQQDLSPFTWSPRRPRRISPFWNDAWRASRTPGKACRTCRKPSGNTIRQPAPFTEKGSRG